MSSTYPRESDLKEEFTVITRKGQITLPVEMRRALDLKQGDRIAVSLDGTDLRLRRAGGVVERTAGIFKTDRQPLSPQDERAEFEKGVAEEVMRSMAT
jgi:AbrB family looped-hinge helix DNA binding protein